MIIYNTREAAEEAKRTDPKYSSGDMIVRGVGGGFAIMPVKEYINWLLKQ
jgi:hypothetical protein